MSGPYTAGPYATDAVQFDMSTSCPLRDVGHGPETYADWNARRANTIYKEADWDGVFVDNVFTDPWWIPLRGRGNVDQNRDNVADSLAGYNSAWTAGMSGWLASLRTVLGPDAVVVTNGVLGEYRVNGALFETFPSDAASPSTWKKTVLGPHDARTPRIASSQRTPPVRTTRAC